MSFAVVNFFDPFIFRDPIFKWPRRSFQFVSVEIVEIKGPGFRALLGEFDLYMMRLQMGDHGFKIMAMHAKGKMIGS